MNPILNSNFESAYACLNEAQKKAVDTIEGPVLVIAGPGTGKTQILAVRIGKILQLTDALPENILCLTYTDAGSIAMRKRLNDFIGTESYRIPIYTFHAFSNQIIQRHSEYFGKRELEQITDLEKINIVEEILLKLPMHHVLRKFKNDLSHDTKKLLQLFQLMKEEGWHSEKISIEIDRYLLDLPLRNAFIYQRNGPGYKKGDIKQNSLNEITDKMEMLRAAALLFDQYQERMEVNGKYDYSDMILWVAKAFKENENILRIYQEQYLYFLVDEFQDTNGAQFEIIQQLIHYWDAPNIFAVGDDDQSIYEFQGARVKNILDFYHAYQKDIEVVVLTENYRSTQPILSSAKSVIENNEDRLIHFIPFLNKNIYAAASNRKNIFIKPFLTEYENEFQEIAGITQAIEEQQKKNEPLNEIAILYHHHKHAKNLIALFEKRKIPFTIKAKQNILNETLIQNLLKILRYIETESKSANSGEHDLFVLMHFRFFKIHPYDIASMSAYLSHKRNGLSWRTTLGDAKVLSEIKLKDADAIIRFEKTISHWILDVHNITLQMLFEKILNESGCLKYILLEEDREWNLELITTLFDYLKSESTKTPRLSITQFLDDLYQMEKHKIDLPLQKNIVKENGVQFITVHSAKGLEFESVYLIGCNDDKWEKVKNSNSKFALPDTLTHSKGDTNIESIRRLFFVAMTRAKQNLYISWYKKKADGKEILPTQFIQEIKSENDIPIDQKTIDEKVLLEYAISNLLETEKPKIDLFDKKFIQQKTDGFALSASALNTYLDCPLKFYFHNIIRIPQAKSDSMSFGSAVHYALKKLFEHMQKDAHQNFPTIETVLKDFEWEMKRNKDSFTDKQFDNKLMQGKKIIPEYYHHYLNSWNKVVVTEFAVRNIIFDGIPLTGIFDKIEFNGQEVNVIDYKTGSVAYASDKLKPPSDKNPLGGDYWRQIVFYKILLDNYKAKNWKMVSGEMDFIEKDTTKNQYVKHKFYLPEGEIETVRQQIKETYLNIIQHKFTEGCGKEDCEWCTFVKENYHK